MRLSERLGVTTRSTTSEDEWRDFAQSLALQLRRLRLRTGLSQEEVAHRANLSRFIYREYENGESRPGFPANPALRSIIAIAQVFEVSIDELLPSPLPDLRSR
ncbi:helix-turn-helix transcriptional regulator [Plantibacter sp. M259]|uniref:helix-turn-helix transcriptional regulator n=1 Tax=Plantibacter sp. M259 TaxID=2583822 RepID=UPI00111080D9|nr:helix-turn-helix transcriptional regulator [Plantibacter sp. M259]